MRIKRGLATTNGGDGGEIDTFSQDMPANVGGSLTVAGGDATTDGSNDNIFIDWMDVTRLDGTY